MFNYSTHLITVNCSYIHLNSHLKLIKLIIINFTYILKAASKSVLTSVQSMIV